jgi:signal transduction histidine kinase
VKSLPDVAEQARRLPAKGLLVFRWLTIVWIIVLAATGSAGQYRPLVTWGAIGVLVVWTAWVSRRQSLNDVELVIDLTLGVGVILVAGIAARPGGIDSGPSLAAYYPLCAVTAWGLARGPGGGILAGAVLTVALAAARLLNATSPALFQGRHVAALANAAIGYLIAGVVIGGFSRLVDRTAQAVEDAMGEALREQSQLSRLRERESLARQIHDSVLQALALVHKRGRELASTGAPSAAAVLELAELARQQELSLRALILKAPQRHAPGQASIREVLEPAVNAVTGVAVNVSVVGTIVVRRREADEVAAAVKEALANVVEHAEATRAAVFVDHQDGTLLVSVRDDGKGFTLDEPALRAAHKAGILRSMKGRIEDMGGSIHISSAPGQGTEIEFRIPGAATVDQGTH